MRAIIIGLLVFVLTSCAPVPESTLTETPVLTSISKIAPSSTTTFTPIPSFTSTPIPATATQPTLLPTQLTLQAMRNPTIVVITPSQDQLERWREYENALGMAIFPPRLLISDVLCEWQILGQSEQEVYVWAICSGYHSPKKLSKASLPAVIVLGRNGDIQSVKTTLNTPANSFGDARRKLFPPDVREKFHNFDLSRLFDQLASRRANPGPPLIVLDATSTPGIP